MQVAYPNLSMYRSIRCHRVDGRTDRRPMRSAALSLFALCVSTVCLGAGHDVTAPVLLPSPLTQSAPTVATNGETFVTLWSFNGELYAAIADATGRRVTTVDVPVIPIPFAYSLPNYALTTAGRDYILFWSDSSSSYLTNLGPDVNPSETVKLRGVPGLTMVSVASNGSQILVSATTSAFAYLVNRDGSLARSPVDLQGFGRPRASWSGRDFLVAVAQNNGVFLHRITSNSETRIQISSATGIFSDPMPGFAAVAESGTETMVVWSEGADSPTPNPTLWSAVVGDDGSVTKQEISSTISGQTNVVWNGESYVASAGKYAMRLDRRGLLLGSPVMVGHYLDDVAVLGEIAYGVGVSPFEGIAIATILRTAGSIHDARSEYVSITPAAQQEPAIAADGTDFITVFREQTATTKSITAAKLDRSRTAAAADAIPIADTTSYAEASIEHGGSTYLVTWADAGGVYARRLSNQGAALDVQPIRIADNEYPQRPDVAWNGNAFVVVWAAAGGIDDATVGEDGAVSAARLITTAGSMEPRLAWNGRLFLLVYGVQQQCSFECMPQRGATYAVRVAADGTPLDQTPASIDRPKSSISYAAARATVASNGAEFLVALDKDSGAAVVNVHTDGASIVTDPAKQIFDWFAFVTNDITWNGHDYVVASRYSMVTKTWLSLAHLSPSGDVLSRGVAELAKFDTTPPAVASNSLGESVVVIAEAVSDPPVQRIRAYVDADFIAAPPRPSPPTNVAATGTPANFTLSWNVPPGAEGIAVQPNGAPFTFAVIPAPDHSHTFDNTAVSYVTVRAFNAGGLSDPVTTGVWAPPRRRTTR
jgi:hypothetical protein